jgi:hypothetical protein
VVKDDKIKCVKVYKRKRCKEEEGGKSRVEER